MHDSRPRGCRQSAMTQGTNGGMNVAVPAGGVLGALGHQSVQKPAIHSLVAGGRGDDGSGVLLGGGGGAGSALGECGEAATGEKGFGGQPAVVEVQADMDQGGGSVGYNWPGSKGNLPSSYDARQDKASVAGWQEQVLVSAGAVGATRAAGEEVALGTGTVVKRRKLARVPKLASPSLKDRPTDKGALSDDIEKDTAQLLLDIATRLEGGPGGAELLLSLNDCKTAGEEVSVYRSILASDLPCMHSLLICLRNPSIDVSVDVSAVSRLPMSCHRCVKGDGQAEEAVKCRANGCINARGW